MDYSGEIIRNLSIKYRTPEVGIKLIMDHVFSEVKSSMGNDDLPEILIHNFGRFKINYRHVKHKILGIYKSIDAIDYKLSNYQRVSKLAAAYRRICKENNLELDLEVLEVENKVNKKIYENSK